MLCVVCGQTNSIFNLCYNFDAGFSGTEASEPGEWNVKEYSRQDVEGECENKYEKTTICTPPLPVIVLRKTFTLQSAWNTNVCCLCYVLARIKSIYSISFVETFFTNNLFITSRKSGRTLQKFQSMTIEMTSQMHF